MDNFKLRNLFFIVSLAFVTKVSGQCNRTGHLFGIPTEYVTNRLTGSDKLYGHPYTIFNKRDYGFFDLGTELEFIRAKIITQKDFNGEIYLAYKAILENANEPRPAEIDPANGVSGLAKWAKSNAFVLLVGLDAAGNSMNLAPYEQNVRDAFWIMNFHADGIEDKHIINFAQSAIAWIQAYDLYKSYIILKSNYKKPYDYDRNEGNCSPRNKMRQMAKRLYDLGMGGAFSWGTINHPTGWKKNHGIICASALLTCAIVLNDAGPRDIRYKWKPSLWAKTGNEGIRDCFFEGYHSGSRNTPATSGDGTAGYNEGPGYWQYTLQTFAPAMLTSNNMYASSDEDNWYNNQAIHQICLWYEKIKLQDGQLPPYDDTNITVNDNIQALIRYYFDRGGTGGMSFHGPDYIVAACQALKYQPNCIVHKKVMEPFTKSDASGNLIYRNVDANKGQHYLHILYEHGDAVSIEAYNGVPGFGDEGTHEHPDMGSIMIAADGQWLAIDPAYMGAEVGGYINRSGHHNKPMLLNSDSSQRPFDDGELIKADESSCQVKLTYANNPLGITSHGSLLRTIEVKQTNGMIYYVVNDKVDVFDIQNEVVGMVVHFNGNGSNYLSENTFVQTDSSKSNVSVSGGRIAKWTHPCTQSKAWSLLTHTAALVKNGHPVNFTSYASDENTVHGSASGSITQNLGVKPGASEDNRYGVHTRTIAKQNAKQTRFQTILIPYRCGVDSLPNIIKKETSSQITTLLDFLAPTDTDIVIPGIIPQPPNYVNEIVSSTDTLYINKNEGVLKIIITQPYLKLERL